MWNGAHARTVVGSGRDMKCQADQLMTSWSPEVPTTHPIIKESSLLKHHASNIYATLCFFFFVIIQIMNNTIVHSTCLDRDGTFLELSSNLNTTQLLLIWVGSQTITDLCYTIYDKLECIRHHGCCHMYLRPEKTVIRCLYDLIHTWRFFFYSFLTWDGLWFM